jgi:hypothetical protein
VLTSSTRIMGHAMHNVPMATTNRLPVKRVRDVTSLARHVGIQIKQAVISVLSIMRCQRNTGVWVYAEMQL